MLKIIILIDEANWYSGHIEKIKYFIRSILTDTAFETISIKIEEINEEHKHQWWSPTPEMPWEYCHGCRTQRNK